MMPSISVWTLRLALVHLGVGLTLGALLLAEKGVTFLPEVNRLLSAHFHTMLFGWTVQLVYGVGYWILPKFRGGTSRGNDALAIAAIALINLGAVAGSFFSLFGIPAAIVYGVETLSALCFALHMWPRVKAFGAG